MREFSTKYYKKIYLFFINKYLQIKKERKSTFFFVYFYYLQYVARKYELLVSPISLNGIFLVSPPIVIKMMFVFFVATIKK